MISLLERLAALRLVVVTGKGGVGKSTVAATLGRLLSAHGRRVLLLDIDPRESLFRLLDVPPAGGRIVAVGPALHLQHLEPRAVLDGFVREQLRIELLARRVVRSTIYEHFVEGAPGLRELAVLGHAWRVVEGRAAGDVPEVDLVVLDAPASGHGLSLLAAPALVSEVVGDGPFAVLAADLARFVADADRCGVVIAALAEEMPVEEAIETIADLERTLDRRPELLVVNRLYPAAPASAPPGPDDPARTLWRRRRAVNDRELERLARSWSGARVELPALPLAPGPALVDGLSVPLLADLRETPWS